MKITFKQLFDRLCSGEKISGDLYINGKKIDVHYYDEGGWRLSTEGKELCMNMSSISLGTEIDLYENLGLGLARYYNGGELPILALNSIAEASCATGFGGASMIVAPLWIKKNGGEK